MTDHDHVPQGQVSRNGRVPNPERGWAGFTGFDVGRPLAEVRAELPPDVPARDQSSAEPLAEVRVKLFGLDAGDAEIQIWAAPEGELAAAQHGGPEQVAALERLREMVNRELSEACRCLGVGAHTDPSGH